MSVTTPTARLHGTVRTAHTDTVALAAADAGTSRPAAAAATMGGMAAVVDALRTLLDRAVDAARGRFDP